MDGKYTLYIAHLTTKKGKAMQDIQRLLDQDRNVLVLIQPSSNVTCTSRMDLLHSTFSPKYGRHVLLTYPAVEIEEVELE